MKLWITSSNPHLRILSEIYARIYYILYNDFKV